MLKFLFQLINKYPIKTKVIFGLSILSIFSVLINASLIYDKYHADPKIIIKEVEVEKEKIVTITKIETEVKTVRIPIETTSSTNNINNINSKKVVKNINKTATDNLTLLENSDLKIRMESFQIIEDDQGKMQFPKTIRGTAQLGYLYYNIETDLKPQLQYRKGLWDLRIMLAGYGGINSDSTIRLGSGYFLQKNFKYPFGLDLPILSRSINIGLGFSGVSLTRPIDLYRGLKADVGIMFDYSGKPAGLVGFSVKL